MAYVLAARYMSGTPSAMWGVLWSPDGGSRASNLLRCTSAGAWLGYAGSLIIPSASVMIVARKGDLVRYTREESTYPTIWGLAGPASPISV